MHSIAELKSNNNAHTKCIEFLTGKARKVQISEINSPSDLGEEQARQRSETGQATHLKPRTVTGVTGQATHGSSGSRA